jgi:hypothetical protein
MIRWARAYWRRYRTRPHVRPWALATPITVLLICLPLLRPLQHPDPRTMSNDEAARLATVQAIAERHTLAVTPMPDFDSNRFVKVNGKLYSDQPPVLAVILAGIYKILQRAGLSFNNNPVLVPYLLTVAGATIPVAAVAGLVYRLGRMFELRRVWRALLAAGVTMGSGLLPYGTVINPHAPAAALIFGAAGALVHIVMSKRPPRDGGWLVLSGLCAATAAAVDPYALPIVIGFGLAILAMRWTASLRVAGLLLYVLGTLPPLLLHAVLIVPVTGDIRPAAWHAELTTSQPEWEEDTSRTVWDAIGAQIDRLFGGLFGSHGILSHFPVMIMGVIGLGVALRRHWPPVVKSLATVSAISALIALLIGAGPHAEEMFGPKWFIAVGPFLLLWSGAWLRREHRPGAWMTAAALLLFSFIMSGLGTANCSRRGGLIGYSPIAVFREPSARK